MVASLEEASKQTSISWPDKREEEEEDDGTNRSGCVVDGVLSPKGTIYCCKHFDSDLAYAQHIVSKMFRCKHGKAYLFDKVSFRVHQAACVHLPPEPCCGAMEILLMICFICLQFKNNLDVLRKMLGELETLKSDVESVVKLKGLGIENIQQSIHGVMIWAPMTASSATTT
ncbi:hypothetical protein ZWY2020_048587 [Hordeum vulgare]|nr:hypothetical protein ZWY2020_048587 [Hordeum vulgare]